MIGTILKQHNEYDLVKLLDDGQIIREVKLIKGKANTNTYIINPKVTSPQFLQKVKNRGEPLLKNVSIGIKVE